MRFIRIFQGATVLVVLLAIAPGRAAGQPEGKDSAVLHRTLMEFVRLRADLDRMNAEVADLKRGERSVRDDYRLRDRMADTEALAQKVTRVEARLRALGWTEGPVARPSPPVAPPQALPQDGSLELEAKAGLFADQARKLDREATVLTGAANELRSRRALRRRAGAWDRDPFSGLESSKRSLAISTISQKSVPTNSAGADSTTRGATGTSSTQTAAGAPVNSAPVGGTSETAAVPPPTLAVPGGAVSDTGAAPSVAPETAASSKTSPLTQNAGLDRQSFEQRLYLDPATAAELRHALGGAGAASDPDALDRAAAALRARAQALNAQAKSLLAKSRTP